MADGPSIGLYEALYAEYKAEHPAATATLARAYLHDNPDHALTLTRLGHALIGLANYGEALEVLTRALTCCDESRRYHVCRKLGFLFEFQGNFDAAAEWLRAAIDAAPHSVADHVFLGEVLARQGMLADAEAVHRGVIQWVESCVDEAHPNLGLVRCGHGGWQEELGSMREAYHNLGLALRGQERLPEALACLNKALHLDPDYQAARDARDDVIAAIRYGAQGEHSTSSGVAGAIRADDGLCGAFFAEYKAEHPAATAMLARAYLRDDPDMAPILLILGEALMELANYGEALAVLMRALECGEESQRRLAYQQLGHLSRHQGKFNAAAEWFQRAIDAAPHDASAHIYLGAALARQGKLTEAEAVHRRATQCSEGCIDEAYLNLGLVLRGQGRLPEALPCFDEALRLDPDYQEAREARDDVVAAIGYGAQLLGERSSVDPGP